MTMIEKTLYLTVTVVIILSQVNADSIVNKTEGRAGKMLPIFQVVNFPNDVCASNSGGRNGTCYTSDECSNLGGASSGTCAEGFGVCCVFSLACGASSSQNATFLVQKSITSIPDGKCDYTICKCSSDICRIRFDFTTFDIAQPFVGTSGPALAAASGGGIGDCITDRFSVTTPGGMGTPIICGFNTGQHLYVDASNECHKASFDILAGDSTSRSWDVKVTQYKCGHEYAGDDGCLQYHVGATGTVASFNFPTSSSSVGATTTHLSDQHYQICIRRESGYCAVCYAPSVQPGAVTADAQVSYGISGANVAGTSLVGTGCTADFITIPLGELQTAAAPITIGTVQTTAATSNERFCGRALHTTTATAQGVESVCSQGAPFVIGVTFDTLEITTEEQDVTSAGGIVGFSIDYAQVKC